jgi:hypothetical protein
MTGNSVRSEAGNKVINGGNDYLVRRFKIIFCNVGIYMFANEKGQKHLVKRYKRSAGERIKGLLQGRD